MYVFLYTHNMKFTKLTDKKQPTRVLGILVIFSIFRWHWWPYTFRLLINKDENYLFGHMVSGKEFRNKFYIYTKIRFYFTGMLCAIHAACIISFIEINASKFHVNNSNALGVFHNENIWLKFIPFVIRSYQHLNWPAENNSAVTHSNVCS